MATNIMDVDRSIHPQRQSALFTALCPELRCLVWTYALPVTYINQDEGIFIRRRRKNKRLTVLNLLAVCRKVYDEAAGLFYHQLRLRIARQDLQSFVRCTSLARRDSIRKLRVDVSEFQEVTSACRRLWYMPQIEEVIFSFGPFSRRTGNAWPDSYLRVLYSRERPILKTCCLNLVSCASIRLEFNQDAIRTASQEAILKEFEEEIRKVKRVGSSKRN